MPTLTAVPGAPGFQLDAPAAAALGRAIASGCPVAITSAYRDPAQQQRLVELHAADPVHYAFALPPNQSEHCAGTAVDTGNQAGTGPMQQWLIAHPDYGFTRTALPNEAWHFAYRAALDQHTADTPEDDMFNDNDRYAQKLLLESQARVEAGIYGLTHGKQPDEVNVPALAATILATLTPEAIAAAIPPAFAEQVAGHLTVTTKE